MVTYRDLLRSHRESLNRLNVYPVPDGDTGTNMALTLDAVVTELEALADSPSMGELCKAISHGSLMGARGNSGVILSQLLRGAGERLAAVDEAGPAEVAAALAHASELARQAVVRPVEGTILTVADAAAGAASRAAGGTLVEVLDAARRSAGATLERTPEMLPALKRAGVVDAGGAGLVLLFDALLAVVDRRALPPPPPEPAVAPGAAAPGATAVAGALATGEVGEDIADLRYEVMYLLEAPDDTIPALKEVWAGIGDSIVVVGGNGLWNCHIHTQDIGAAIEAALDAGRPRDIRVTDLLEQVEEERWVRESADGGDVAATPSGPPPATAVVAVVNGVGLGRIFRSLGAFWQVQGGQTLNPSTGQLLEAVESTGSPQVVILPNNANVRLVAEQVGTLAPGRVAVVPTDSIVEGFAALLAYDPASELEDNLCAMTASASRVVPGEITRAVRDAETAAGSVREGEWIALSREGVVTFGEMLSDVVCALLGALIGDEHELVTIIEGEGSSAADTRRITEWLHDEHPSVAAEVHHGGQPLYPYLLGVE